MFYAVSPGVPLGEVPRLDAGGAHLSPTRLAPAYPAAWVSSLTGRAFLPRAGFGRLGVFPAHE